MTGLYAEQDGKIPPSGIQKIRRSITNVQRGRIRYRIQALDLCLLRSVLTASVSAGLGEILWGSGVRVGSVVAKVTAR